MPCYSPWLAERTDQGEVVFAKRGATTLELPCGRCIGCRLERSRQWAVRCMHEASLYERNCFVTLTYSDDSVTSLDYRDFQLFMKRVRGWFSPVRVRFYMAGEYGEDFSRPHFHALLFNCDFPDKLYWSKSPSGEDQYRSAILERLWPQGFSTIGAVTFRSAAYVARYVQKKVMGQGASVHYSDADGVIRTPEFNRMSLDPGIGAGWLAKFNMDVSREGLVVVDGVEVPIPRYYVKVLEGRDPEKFDEIVQARHRAAVASFVDRSESRLKVRETVTKARVKQLKRSL